jgi:heat shock protein HslJ
MAAALTSACAGTSPTDASAPPLVGTTWRLTAINGREALPGVRVTARFGDDQRVTGTAGCNQYFGGASVSGARLSVGLLGSTRMHCGDVVQPQEDAYLSALAQATTYRIEGSELRLGPDSGSATLVFRQE